MSSSIQFSFVERIITASVTLAQGSFAGTAGQNKVDLSGYRMAARIVKAGGNSQGQCEIAIFGLGLSLMNQLSTLGRTPVFIDTGNKLTVQAGDSQSGLSVVFQGTIMQAYTDLSSPPDAVFLISAYAGLGEAMTSISASSFSGAVDAADVMQSLASAAGLTFERNGVSVMLHKAYYPGSIRSQMQACADAANINWIIDEGKLAIWTKSGFRAGEAPLISADTGMIGYPFPSGQGLLGVRTLFNNQISFGSQIQVQSTITPANGKWSICHIDHDISCLMPGGPWMTTLLGTPPGYIPTVQG